MPSLTIEEVKQYSKWESDIFIETGTNIGDTLYNVQDHFSKLYSIELSIIYVKKAMKRFINNNKVCIIHGDSSVILKTLNEINGNIFFWLDGHWSGGDTARGELDCPLLHELKIINDNYKQKCIVVIDDARLFGTNKNENWSSITKENILNIVKDRLISCEYFPSICHVEDRMVLHLN